MALTQKNSGFPSGFGKDGPLPRGFFGGFGGGYLFWSLSQMLVDPKSLRYCFLGGRKPLFTVVFYAAGLTHSQIGGAMTLVGALTFHVLFCV